MPNEELSLMPPIGIDTPDEEAGGATEARTLYLVATPIGNLSDLSPRAIRTLREADFIAAEDTRHTAKLLAHFGIHTPQVSYHEHNKREAGIRIADRIAAGETCALVTDAGMPAISDPGEDLVRLCVSRGLPVRCIPGANAALSALVLSALPTRRFTFEGFLPTDAKQRRERLEELRNEPRTMLLYEAPHRLTRTLKELENVFGPTHAITLCRELTKRNEEILRTDFSGALQHTELHEPRGEYVLVIDGVQKEHTIPEDLPPIPDHVAQYEKQGLSHKDAMKAVARDRHLSKSAVYRALLETSTDTEDIDDA